MVRANAAQLKTLDMVQQPVRRPEGGLRRAKPAASVRSNPMVIRGIAVGLCAALALSFLSIETATIAEGYRLAHVERKLHEVRTEHERLRLLASQLSSLERVEREARTRLGMIDPDKVEYIVISPPSNGNTAIASEARKIQKPLATRLLTALGASSRDSILGLMSVFVARWF